MLTPNKLRFPSGIKWLSEQVHQKGKSTLNQMTESNYTTKRSLEQVDMPCQGVGLSDDAVFPDRSNFSPMLHGSCPEVHGIFLYCIGRLYEIWSQHENNCRNLLHLIAEFWPRPNPDLILADLQAWNWAFILMLAQLHVWATQHLWGMKKKMQSCLPLGESTC